MPTETRTPLPTVVEADGDLLITTNSSTVEPGTYEAELVDMDTFEYEADDGVRKLLRWQFSLVDHDDALVEGVSSLATGPRAKAFAWLAAIVGTEAVSKSRATFKRSELLGKRVLAVVEVDDKGFSKVARLAPLPKGKAK